MSEGIIVHWETVDDEAAECATVRRDDLDRTFKAQIYLPARKWRVSIEKGTHRPPLITQSVSGIISESVGSDVDATWLLIARTICGRIIANWVHEIERRELT